MILEFPTNLQIPTYKYVKGSLKPSHSKCNYSFTHYLLKAVNQEKKEDLFPKIQFIGSNRNYSKDIFYFCLN